MKVVLNFRTLSVFLIMLTSSCNLLTTNGNLGASGSIEESKKRGVFIYEYKPPQNPFRINDSLSINVKSAWIEHHWLYAGLFSEKAKIEKEGLQLIIITDEQSIKTYSKDWLIGIDFDKNIRTASKSALIADFETIPGDSIIWKVQKGIELAESFHKTIIGKFVLVKVQ